MAKSFILCKIFAALTVLLGLPLLLRAGYHAWLFAQALASSSPSMHDSVESYTAIATESLLPLALVGGGIFVYLMAAIASSSAIVASYVSSTPVDDV